MMNLLLLLVGIVACSAAIALSVKKINIVPLIAMGVTFFLWIYIIVCGILFWLDKFSIVRGLCVSVIVSIAACCSLIQRRKNIEIDFNIKSYIFVLVLMIAALPFTARKYEYFGMGQDEGVYQTQAINFIYGKNEIQQDFEDYLLLETEQERQEYKDKLVEELIGLYNYDPELPFASVEKERSYVSAVFHGIPTFSALLALAGSIVGIRHMADIQTVFYFALLIYAYMAMEALNFRRSLKYLLTALLAFSPMILWVSKSSMTEIILSAIMASFIYFIVNGKKEFIYLSCMPVVTFCFFHLTIYTMIPVIVLIYWICWWCEGHRACLIAAGISITAFAVGIFLAMNIAGTYAFVINFKPIYNLLPMIDASNIFLFFVALCVLFYILTFILYGLKKYRRDINIYEKKVFLWGSRAIIILFVIAQFYFMYTRREIYAGNIESFKHLSVVGFAYCLGIFVPLSMGILWFLKPELILKEKATLCCGILFAYCVGVYCSVFRVDIAYYYYYGRYLAPFIVVIVLASGIIFNQMKIKWGVVFVILSLLVIAPYEMFFVQYKDDTRVTWNILEDLQLVIKDRDVVIFEDELLKYYFLPVKAMTGANVFPEFGNLDNQVKELAGQTAGEVYYISSTVPEKDMGIIYSNVYIMMQDNNTNIYNTIPFPKEVAKEKKSVMCSKHISSD